MLTLFPFYKTITITDLDEPEPKRKGKKPSRKRQVCLFFSPACSHHSTRTQGPDTAVDVDAAGSSEPANKKSKAAGKRREDSFPSLGDTAVLATEYGKHLRIDVEPIDPTPETYGTSNAYTHSLF
jgi:hypothetical protein